MTLRSLFFGLLTLLALVPLTAQKRPTLDYYLPAGTQYDRTVPTPAAFLGYEVGEWHVSHDQLLGYMRELARTSPRIRLQEYGRTHENRPLLCLTFSAPANLSRLEEIRTARRKLADPKTSGTLNPADFPAVNYMGYSIHGNEASGSNAALIVAYYLAAAQGTAIDSLLRNTVILFDPCFNPDGMQRFSSWVNSRRSANQRPDSNDDEFSEHWPGGRFNHYWFDLNRDWLVCQQPESGGRVKIFQDWLPNVLTDHHEMGTNSTFFFQPGVSTRVNPITPARNQQLTAQIALYHARTLSDKKVLFYSGENFDDFYYGKGSTYPDANGCVGILFEQGSSRGSAQESENGLLTFPYSIRNQVLTSLSTLNAVREMRVDLNSYLRDFYTSALDDARRDAVQGYVFEKNVCNLAPVREFFAMLKRHNIEVRELRADLKTSDKTFSGGSAFFVPVDQPQYRLVRGIFERTQQFQDSIFYDISAWTLPDAFGLNWAAVRRADAGKAAWIGDIANWSEIGNAAFVLDSSVYAFVVGAEDYYLPRVLQALHKRSIRVKVATQPFTANGQQYAAGSLMIPLDRQAADNQMIYSILDQNGACFSAVTNGQTAEGPDLGSSNFVLCRQPKVLLLTGEGANALDVGEIWHLLDTRYALSPTLVETARFGATNLTKYNVIIMADGNYNNLAAEKMREFVTNGGTVIGTGNALKWLKTNNLANIEWRTTTGIADLGKRRSYGSLSEDQAARALPGAIFNAELDITHPVCYGYQNTRIPMFMGDTIFIEPTQNPYATPAVYAAKEPLLSGYMHSSQRKAVSGSAAIVVSGIGRGRVICFAGNPCFRGFWYGTNRLMGNAIFFGNLISGGAVEKKK